MANDVAQRGYSDRLAAWLVIPLAALLTIVLIVFYGLFITTTVDGESMLPTLLPGDKLLVTKGYSAPIRGDIVVVHRYDELGRPHEVVKRIIAVPGDTVEIRADVAWVNGAPEPDRDMVFDSIGVDRPSRRVPEGTVFVMGDNRPVSFDSRYVGVMPIRDIQGRVAAIFAPITRVQQVN